MAAERKWNRNVMVTAVLSSVAVLVFGFQNCAGYRSQEMAGGFSSLSSGSSVTSYALGFKAPQFKQGTGESHWIMSDADHDARYATLKSWGAGYRHYNLYWGVMDDSGALSTAQPQTCDGAHVLVPANEAERVALGYHRYRCINKQNLAMYDNLFTRDQLAGFQTGVAIWSAPAIYRHPKCEGFNFVGNYMYDGCVPRDDAMDDFEDFMNMVASRWNGGARGKVSHYIIWNENASAEWFDYTPVSSKTSTAADQVKLRLDKMADMMKRVAQALGRHQRQALMYVSTDNLWTPNQAAGHMGTQTLIQGLWDRLGLNYAWGIAVHPYGDVLKTPRAGIYSFNNLEMVSKYQADQLAKRGVNDPTRAPQYQLIATEQGWDVGANGNRDYQASQICFAHAKAVTLPNLVAVAHNYFHSHESNDTSVDGVSNQGHFFGLIPFNIPDSLAGAENTPTGKAYVSTMGTTWGSSDTHYCCQNFQLGCKTPPVVVRGLVEAVSTAGVVTGWSCGTGVEAGLNIQVFAGGEMGTGRAIGVTVANQAGEANLATACGTQGSAHRFSFTIPAAARMAGAGQKLYVYGALPAATTGTLLTGSGNFAIPAN